ncbi:MAG: hypothetical protein LBD57_04335 [Endomicrobium sp.]|jgi:hypothetical protein|uniref:hypothetical protein n=1 Tax=Candidatus Endomicrobiellum cubanum TaxID=3242325 RepID=UPI002819C194|nr:hypothetical protein [Endomicrobium sp.]
MLRKKSNNKLLKEEERRVLLALQELEPGSVEHNKILVELEKISNLKRINMETLQKIAPTLMVISGNLAIALLVMKHEKIDVITTKLFWFLAKPKL